MKETRNETKERKDKKFPINIKRHIEDSPCGLTVKQANEMVPGYRKEFNRIIKFKKNLKNVNYIESSEPKITPMRAKAEIEDIEIDAIIDTGAAVSAITWGLMKELGYDIDRPSDIKVVNANGGRSRSLGKIIDMKLLLGGVEIILTVQVIESIDRLLILGNDWLQKVRANIDMNNGKIKIRENGEYVNIPIEFESWDYEDINDKKNYEDSDDDRNIDDKGDYNNSDDEEYENENLREVRF